MKYSRLQSLIALLMTLVVGLAAFGIRAIAAPSVPASKAILTKSTQADPSNMSAAGKFRATTQGNNNIMAKPARIIRVPPSLVSSPDQNGNSSQAPYDYSVTGGSIHPLPRLPYPELYREPSSQAPSSKVYPQVAVYNKPLGNIAPYRKEILYGIGQNWHPKRPVESIVVNLEIACDGTLLQREIAVSSGSKRSDKELLEAIDVTQFPPLPEWYKENSLIFKLELRKTAENTGDGNPSRPFIAQYYRNKTLFPKPMILLGRYPKESSCVLSSNAHFARTNISSALSHLYLWRKPSVLSPALISSIAKLSDASNFVGQADRNGSRSQSSVFGIGYGMGPGNAIVMGIGIEGVGARIMSPPIALEMTPKIGSIIPYRKEVLYRIAQNWQLNRSVERVVVLVDIARDGTLLNKKLLVSSGSKHSDKEILKIVDETIFPPLPDWYKGQSLTYKLELSRVVDR